MSWAYVNKSTASGANAVLTPPAITAGNLLVLIEWGGTFADQAGWNQLCLNLSNGSLSAFWKIASASEPTVSSGSGKLDTQMVMLQYSGIDSISAFDALTVGTSNPSVTTTKPNDLLIYAYTATYNSGTWTAVSPAGTTTRVLDQPGAGCIIFDVNQAAVGASAGYSTNVGAGGYQRALFAFKDNVPFSPTTPAFFGSNF